MLELNVQYIIDMGKIREVNIKHSPSDDPMDNIVYRLMVDATRYTLKESDVMVNEIETIEYNPN